MANAYCSIHIYPDDAPYLQRLDGGSIACWLEGKHVGPSLTAVDDAALANLRDAIDAFLAPADTQQVAA